MALIKCPECGRERVSDSALACPDCGFGVRDYVEKERKKAEEETYKKAKAEKELVDKKEKISQLMDMYKIKLNKLENSKPNIEKLEMLSLGCWVLAGFIIIASVILFVASVYLIESNEETAVNSFNIMCIILPFIIPIVVANIVIKRKMHKVEYCWDRTINKKKEQLKNEYEKKADNVLKYGNAMGIDYGALEKNSNANINKYIPKCPICGSTNITRLTVFHRFFSIIFLGPFSAKFCKQFECLNCECRW